MLAYSLGATLATVNCGTDPILPATDLASGIVDPISISDSLHQ
jgi:hypothetical protein